MIRRFLWSAYWAALSAFFFGLNVAMAAPGTTTDAHNHSCATASQLNDATLGVVGPMIGPLILLALVGIQTAGDRMSGVLHQGVNVVAQHSMVFILAASALAFGSLISVANGVAACP